MFHISESPNLHEVYFKEVCIRQVGIKLKMSAKPDYTRTEINSLRVGPLKDALTALGLPFNGGVGDGRKIL